MPGQLKPDAKCPECGKDILLVFRGWIPAKRTCDMTFMHRDRDVKDCMRTVTWDMAMSWNQKNYVAYVDGVDREKEHRGSNDQKDD